MPFRVSGVRPKLGMTTATSYIQGQLCVGSYLSQPRPLTSDVGLGTKICVAGFRVR